MWSILLSLTIAGHVSASIVDKGRVIALGGVSYYTGGIPVARLDVNDTREALAASSDGHDLLPLTVVETSANFSIQDLAKVAAEYGDLDDVFQSAFLQTLYLQSTGGNAVPVSDSIGSTLEDLNVKLLITSDETTADSESVVTKSEAKRS